MPREVGERRYKVEIAGKPGARGRPGKSAPEPLENVSGADGSVDHQRASYLEADCFGEQLTPVLGNMLLRQSILDHLNGNYKEAAERLAWLSWLLGPNTPRAANHARIVDTDLPGEETLPDHEFDQLRRQVAIQVKRLELGLDAYGNAPSFIPMLTYAAYGSYIDKWLRSAREVEQLYDEYYNEDYNQKASFDAASKSLGRLDALIANLQEDIIETEERRNFLLEDIANLLDSVQNAAADLLRASAEFRDAVERAGGCEIADVVAGAGALIAIAGGATGAAAAIGPMLAAIKTENEDTFKYLGAIADTVKVLGTNVNEIGSAYTELKHLLADGPTPNLPSDTAKIIVDRDALIKKVEEYKRLPEAQAYIETINRYVDLVLARNAKIMQHDALILQAREAESRIETARSDQNDIKVLLATTQQPYLPKIADFMRRSLDAHKSELVKALYYAHRALAYMTLASSKAEFERQTVAQLNETYFNLDTRLREANESRGQAHKTMSLGNPTGVFSLKNLAGNEGLQRLKAKDRVAFSIPEDAFADYHHVYATKVRAQFVGIAASGKKPGLRLVHTGHAKFFDRKGGLQEFVHAARPTIAYDFEVESLGQDDEFIALTPYGPWLVDVSLAGNRDVNFADLEDVLLEFEVRYQPNL